MSGKTIGQLSAATSLDGTELLEIEQAGASKYMTLNNLIGTTVITGDYTANNFNENIIVNSASALTITIPADLEIGTIKNILRFLSASTAVTVARSGTELIEGAASFIVIGAKNTSQRDISETTLRKGSASEWWFVSGSIRCEASNGRFYEKRASGILVCGIDYSIDIVTASSSPYAYEGEYTWTYPHEYAAAPVVTPPSIESVGAHIAVGRIRSSGIYSTILMGYASVSNTYRFLSSAVGRWRV